LLAAARASAGHTVLDVSTGTGEAALMALTIVRSAGLVIGADVAPEMLEAARARLNAALFWPVAADGQTLPFRNGSFDAVLCQLGLQFFPDPALRPPTPCLRQQRWRRSLDRAGKACHDPCVATDTGGSQCR
jgi:ubiquinone/menaquinone biosynthesis C-methylase UbiE